MSGDTITLDQLPEATSVNTTDIFWLKAANVDKHIEAGNFLQWTLDGSALYPKSTGTKVGIGTTVPGSAFKLDVNGHVKIRDNLYVADYLHIGTTGRIYEAGGVLKFYDEGYGSTISLSELAQSATSLSSGSGVTVDAGNNIDWDGALSEDTEIDFGNYRIYFTNTFNERPNYFRILYNNLSVLFNNISFIANNSYVMALDSVVWGYTPAKGFFATDNRTAYKGWSYTADYSDNIKDNPNSFASSKTVNLLIRDSLGNTFFEEDTMRSSNYNTVYEGQFEADTFVVDLMTAVPSVAVEGMIVGLTDHTAKYYNGSSWDDLNITKSDAIDTVGLHSFISLNCDTIYVGDSTIVEGDFPLGSGGTPAGNANDVQIYRAGSFDGSDSLEWDGYRLKMITKGGAVNHSTFVGGDAGGGTGDANVGIGWNAMGTAFSGAQYNTAIGHDALPVIIGGDYNVAVGEKALQGVANGNGNIGIGYRTGYSLGGADSLNIFIGHQAGYNETSSCRLYIDNSSTSSPLIWGNFIEDSVRINGDLVVTQNFWLPALAPSDTAVVVILPTGLLDTIPIGQVADDEFILEQIPFWEYQDHWQKNNRLKGMRETADINKFMNDILRQVERNYMYDAELRSEVKKLKTQQRLLIGFILLILIAGYIRKCLKK